MNYLKKNKKYFDPVIFSNDNSYNPWGKPGGGAPLTDRGTNKPRTKIEGTMQWNLDGQSLSAKKRNKLYNSTENLSSSSSNTNILGSSHNYYSDSNDNLTFIEKQAEMRNLMRKSRNLNRETHEMSGALADIENDNYANLWFGRQGGGAPIDATRRQKLMMRLEDRSPVDYSNGTIKRVYPKDPLAFKRLPHERFYEP